MKNITKIFWAFILLGGALVVQSCQKDNEGVFNYPRLFAPIQLKADAKYDIVQGGMATVSWLKRDSAISYTIELFQDSMQFSDQNLVAHRVLPAAQDTAVFLGLVASTNYSVRVRANAADDSKTSKYNPSAFKVPAENIFIYGVNSDSITDVTAWLRWFGGPRPVTKLVYKYSGGSSVTHDLTLSEQSASLAELASLEKGKLYTVTAYNGDVKRGSTTLRTADIYLNTPGDFSSYIGLLPNGGVLAMGEGTYSIGTATTFASNVSVQIKGISGGKTKVISALGGAGTAVFTLPVTASSSTIKFLNLYFDAVNGTAGRSQYLFNQTAACSVNKLSFDGCYFEGFLNSPLRIQGTPKKSIDTLEVNNCIVTDIAAAAGAGNYAFIHNSATDSSLLSNIRVTNSTVYNTALGVIQNDKSNAKSIILSNCTFYDMLKAADRYMINCGTFDVTSLQIDNCVFSSTKAPAGGIKTGNAATTVNVTNSYKTSDFNDAGANDADNNYSIPNLTGYSGASSALYLGPLLGAPTAVNFTYKDASFVGKSSVGDPRWRVK